MWNLKKDTSELIHKTEIDSQTLKTTLCFPKGEVGGDDKLGVQDEQIHTTICKIGKQQGHTV